MVNLDTHMLVFALNGSLRKKERAVLESNAWGISAIVLWEIAKMMQLGRLELAPDGSLDDLLGTLHIWPLSWQVAEQSCQLDFSSDPADELIAATSICHNVPLVTRDKRILRSSLIRFA